VGEIIFGYNSGMHHTSAVQPRRHSGNIFLVGMMGAGKTTVGRLLAQQLGKNFFDSDEEIQRRTGVSIPHIFDVEGEVGFRQREAGVIRDLAALDNVVLATGGGVVLRPVNRQYLHDRGHVVYLNSSPDELFRRLRHDVNRPLLQVADPLGRLRDLYALRDPLYRQTSHFIIETGRPSVSTLVNMIVMQLELSGVVPG